MSAPDRLEDLETSTLVRLLLEEEARVPEVVSSALADVVELVDLAVAGLRSGGRLIYVGAGTSGRLAAADAAECWSTFGVDAESVCAVVAGGLRSVLDSNPAAEDDESRAMEEIEGLDVGPNDLVVGISASGTTPFTRAALRAAVEAGARTGLVTSSSVAADELDRAVRLPVGEELLRGSTRLKAGTSAKIVLGTLSTALMVRMGYTRGRDMIRVRTTNRKLRARAAEIVQRQARCTRARAERALDATGGNVMRAIDDLESEVDPTVVVPERVSVEDQDPRAAVAYCIGIDAGGTSIRVVVGRPEEAGAALTLEGEGANFTSSPSRALDGLRDAVERTRDAIGCPTGPFGSACIGAAGAGAEPAAAPLREWARKELALRTLVTNDADPLLWSMEPGGTRIGLISGTGYGI